MKKENRFQDLFYVNWYFETKSLLNEIMENGRFFTTLFSNLKVYLNSEENINNLKIKGNSNILSLLIYRWL